MKFNTHFMIGERRISCNDPTYFIADIGANHDGSLKRAKDLIKRAWDAGADCVKFQHFKADKIVSREGFEGLKTAHQKDWDKSVYEIYEDYSINREWTVELAEEAKKFGIDFMTTPYDLAAIYDVEPYVPAFKIGSGDITYLDLIREVAGMGKPVFLATGASTMGEVQTAVTAALGMNPQLCLMQCNTNYSGDHENIRYSNLKVLQTYSLYWPYLPLGLSDHTHNHTAVLGAVALGARVIEKHFTDDKSRPGPDHKFALMKLDWLYMRQAVRELEAAMGDGDKRVETNEKESVIVQRRAMRLTRDLPAGTVLTEGDVEALRPCPEAAFTPADMHKFIGKTLSTPAKKGEALFPIMLSIA